MPRWIINVDQKTDRAIRTHLARKGGKKGDLSQFVADAARRAALRETVDEFRTAFADLPPEEAQALADEAVKWARAHPS